MPPFSKLIGTPYVVLDTETTGLGRKTEICELSILCGQTNKTIFNSLVNPTIMIPDDAIAIHGITNQMVADAPTWEEVYPKVREVLAGKLLVIYNVQYDVRIMNYCCDRIQQPNHDYFGSLGYYCAMKEYADYRKVEDFFRKSNKWFKLIDAFEAEGLRLPEGFETHRAEADTILVQALIVQLHKKFELR